MSRLRPVLCLAISGLICATGFIGCRSRGEFVVDHPPVGGPPPPRQIETACVDIPPAPDATSESEPLTIGRDDKPEDWHLTLEEVIQITLANSDVIRDIGGRVVAAPQGVNSIYDVALQEIDPLTGVEAALSDFDARVATNLFFLRDERTPNNPIQQGQLTGANSFAFNTGAFDVELSKQSVTGTRYALRNVTDYGRFPPSFPNRFPSAYNTAMEAEFRHPLLRGSGIDFNRIAGPNGRPGAYNGVVLARIRTDIALADFEASVRNLLRDVEGAYWQLYFAYRTLDARSAAYELALGTWRIVQDQLEAGTVAPDREALARANFYLTKVSVQNGLSGGPAGSGIVGVYSAERTLRHLMGIPANDGRLIRPADEPSVAQRIFDWQDSLQLALTRRVELRRQKWTIKQREGDLLAARNLLLSQLDLVGLYRWRGFGDALLGNRNVDNGSAFRDLFTGDLQGWQLGLQYSTPLGKRREHAAVRFAELNLAREKAVLRNQELKISNDLSGQFAELDRAYLVTQANVNRMNAEQQRLQAEIELFKVGADREDRRGQTPLEFVLQAQRDRAIADSDYYQTLVEYNLAVAEFHLARGTYLDYLGVHLSEGPWAADAYRSYSKEFRRFKPRMNYCITTPAVSRGPYPQESLGYEAVDTPDAGKSTSEDTGAIRPPPNGIPPDEPRPSVQRLPGT